MQHSVTVAAGTQLITHSDPKNWSHRSGLPADDLQQWIWWNGILGAWGASHCLAFFLLGPMCLPLFACQIPDVKARAWVQFQPSHPGVTCDRLSPVADLRAWLVLRSRRFSMPDAWCKRWSVLMCGLRLHSRPQLLLPFNPTHGTRQHLKESPQMTPRWKNLRTQSMAVPSFIPPWFEIWSNFNVSHHVLWRYSQSCSGDSRAKEKSPQISGRTMAIPCYTYPLKCHF